jgi:hypothetical protein
METLRALLRSTSQEGTRSHFGLEANLAYAHYGSASVPGSGFVGARGFPIKLTMVLLLMSCIFMASVQHEPRRHQPEKSSFRVDLSPQELATPGVTVR